MELNLTEQEQKMIRKALDSYGNKVADSQGYSADEPYWDLIEKFQEQPTEEVDENEVFETSEGVLYTQKNVTQTEGYQNPSMQYLDHLECAVWDVFKDYCAIVGIEFEDEDEVDFRIAKGIQENIIGYVEELSKVPFPVHRELGAQEIMSNMVDELERAKAVFSDIRAMDDSPYDFLDELESDIDADLDRFYSLHRKKSPASSIGKLTIVSNPTENADDSITIAKVETPVITKALPKNKGRSR